MTKAVDIRFGSICSGIEAASVAWRHLGWKAAWLSEIEPFPCAVLAHHYPNVKNIGDMTKLPERIVSGEVEAPDVLCGGTPCQAFSVAGLRKSLDDARGNLSLVFCEIANEIDSIRSILGKQPSIIFWENVPGVLSTKDNAFGCFLAGLAGEDDALIAPGGKWSNAGVVLGPQRAVAWRVLDAQYFGVAQRRRRVFVVASARDGFDPAAVLFEFDGVRRDTAPSREAGQAATGSAGASAASRSWPAEVSSTLDTTFGTKQGLEDQHVNAGCPLFVPVAFDTTQITSPANGSNPKPGDPCHPISARAHAPAVAFPANLSGTQCASAEDIAPAMGAKNPTAVAIQGNLIGRDAGGSMGVGASDVGVMYTLNTVDVHGVAAATPINTQMALRGPHTSNTPREGLGCGSPGDPAFTLQAAHHHAVQQAMQVRRLTPVECERLQGFPDGYTQIPWRKKPASECPDGPRYKALGNSWAVPVVSWIGMRIDLQIGQRHSDNDNAALNEAAA